MGFGGNDGCVKTGPSLYGECPFHPRESMLRYKTCLLEGLRREKVPETKTCDLIGCAVIVAEGKRFCSPEHEKEATVGYEFVDHPRHYNEHPGGIECIDVIEHMTHNIGAAVKYLWRVGLKPGEGYKRDLEKAKWYINREIERLDKAKK